MGPVRNGLSGGLNNITRTAREHLASACPAQAPELPRMTRAQFEACSKTKLEELARRQGVAGWHGMRKDELIHALLIKARNKQRAALRKLKKATPPRNGRVKAPVHAPVQKAVARNTSGTPTAEEQVESSKYDV